MKKAIRVFAGGIMIFMAFLVGFGFFVAGIEAVTDDFQAWDCVDCEELSAGYVVGQLLTFGLAGLICWALIKFGWKFIKKGMASEVEADTQQFQEEEQHF
ncbi:MAG: hypothetical protein H6581_03565 [Bacteroidia bacterium]|nr:hypothetical protein [Bacteroidia bacterium]